MWFVLVLVLYVRLFLLHVIYRIYCIVVYCTFCIYCVVRGRVSVIVSCSSNGLTCRRSMSFAVRPARKRPLGKSALETQPKLFGGSIEEYVQASCILRICNWTVKLSCIHSYKHSICNWTVKLSCIHSNKHSICNWTVKLSFIHSNEHSFCNWTVKLSFIHSNKHYL